MSIIISLLNIYLQHPQAATCDIVNVKQAGEYRVIALYGNVASTIRFSINHRPASECKLPIATGSMHIWNKGQIGTITFPEVGLQLLTFHYGKGNNFAYFEFEPTDKQ